MRLSTRHLKLRLTELLIGLFIVTVIVIVLAVVVEALFGHDANAQSPTTGLYFSKDCSSWTVMISELGGLTCIVAEGQKCQIRDGFPAGNPL